MTVKGFSLAVAGYERCAADYQTNTNTQVVCPLPTDPTIWIFFLVKKQD